MQQRKTRYPQKERNHSFYGLWNPSPVLIPEKRRRGRLQPARHAHSFNGPAEAGPYVGIPAHL